ncbi:MerR family transcriptional regulator [Streptomyces sp. NPDC005904]|uniref:MerR family transcriptional regulator n=1 Tax=Streptomyces sp. NPDC005904 TaxID=3154570 RepID=UPI0033C6FA47
MRIGEFSRRVGVPIPTIKYYLRQGLLPPGILTSPNQALYGPRHEHRLRLVRALSELGGVPLARVRAVLKAMTEPDPTPLGVLRALREQDGGPDRERKPVPELHSEPEPEPEPEPDPHPDAGPEHDRSRAVVLETFTRRGWRISPDASDVRKLTTAVLAVRRLGHADLATAALDAYADAGERTARVEARYIAEGRDPRQRAERAVMAALLGEALQASVRRLALEEAVRAPAR